MPLTLRTVETRSVVIKSLIVDQFSVRPNDRQARVQYHFRDSNRTVVTSGSLDITDTNFDSLLVRINELLDAMTSASVYEAIKRAMYENIMEAEGLTGDIE